MSFAYNYEVQKKDGKVMEGEWKNYGNFKGQIKKDGKLISVKK